MVHLTAHPHTTMADNSIICIYFVYEAPISKYVHQMGILQGTVRHILCMCYTFLKRNCSCFIGKSMYFHIRPQNGALSCQNEHRFLIAAKARELHISRQWYFRGIVNSRTRQKRNSAKTRYKLAVYAHVSISTAY